MSNKWKRKAHALARLAEDQRGTPEGDLAREKLAEILRKHPEAVEYEPIKTLAERDLTMADVAWMKRHGVSVEGSWTGKDFAEALHLMEEDYWQRIMFFQKQQIATIFGVPPEYFEGEEEDGPAPLELSDTDDVP